MTIHELNALLAANETGADAQVFVVVDDELREITAEVDADGDLVIIPLSWTIETAD